jgi:hypothetical protein
VQGLRARFMSSGASPGQTNMDAYADYFPDSNPTPGGSACGCWQPMGIVGNGAVGGQQSGAGQGPFGIPWLVLLAIAGLVVALSKNSNTRGGS